MADRVVEISVSLFADGASCSGVEEHPERRRDAVRADANKGFHSFINSLPPQFVISIVLLGSYLIHGNIGQNSSIIERNYYMVLTV